MKLDRQTWAFLLHVLQVMGGWLPTNLPMSQPARTLSAHPRDEIVSFALAVVNVAKTVCPSGLRGWTQVPLAQAAWAQIPQLSV